VRAADGLFQTDCADKRPDWCMAVEPRFRTQKYTYSEVQKSIASTRRKTTIAAVRARRLRGAAQWRQWPMSSPPPFKADRLWSPWPVAWSGESRPWSAAVNSSLPCHELRGRRI